MAKSSSNTRILIEFGYSDRFLLPAGTSADQMAVLANAVKIDESYSGPSRGSLCPSQTSNSKVKVYIISANEISKFVDEREGEDAHEDYDIIIEEVKNRIGNKNHGVIRFRKKNIIVGDEEIDYEDLANPETDPETIIDSIVSKALVKPINI